MGKQAATIHLAKGIIAHSTATTMKTDEEKFSRKDNKRELSWTCLNTICQF